MPIDNLSSRLAGNAVPPGQMVTVFGTVKAAGICSYYHVVAPMGGRSTLTPYLTVASMTANERWK